MHEIGGVTRQVRVSFQSGHFDLLHRQKYVIDLHSWLKKSYRGLRFGTHTYIASVLIPTYFRHGWLIFCPLAGKNTWKGALVELPASEKFCRLFCTCSDISVRNLVTRFSRWCHVKFEFHSNLDTLTYFTAKNRSQSFICIHGFKSYIEASDLVHTFK